MIFYRVMPKYDNFRKPMKRNAPNFDIYIANELYTKKEAEQQKLNLGYMEAIEIPKNKTYWFFGARFAIDDAHAAA